MNNFTKKDIKNGAVVELRNGKRFLKVDNSLFGLKNDELYENNTSYMLLHYYDYNLKSAFSSDYDIMRVLNPKTKYMLLDLCHDALLALRHKDFSWTWEREEKKKIKLKDMTFEQYDKWTDKHCRGTNCKSCIFYKVPCGEWHDDCWICNKEIYSEKFLNQEIGIEEE